ncbi:unnamed protein product [Hydatigera taeniaeformis]|uniref:Zinc finger protein 318 n=1 Tax=Hydatigena taeniaeformis TaxID=6205 RepID=A0A0R3WJY3_HYDTA|nr:unnamed protein product [Hydatigera taeniaeformis]
MPGKSRLGQHLDPAKFASLKGFLISSDEDDDSEEEQVNTMAHSKQKHTSLEEEEDDDVGDAEVEWNRDLHKPEKSFVASRCSSSGRKRYRHEQRRRSQKSASPPAHSRHRSSRTKMKSPDKRALSREVTTSSDSEKEAKHINREGEVKYDRSLVKQSSKDKLSRKGHDNEDRSMTNRPPPRQGDVSRKPSYSLQVCIYV